MACAAALACALPSLPAHAQAQPAAEASYALPAQPLEQSLVSLARQAGLQLVADQALVQGREAPAVAPTGDLRAALDAALRDSGLRARVEGGALVVERAPAGTPAVAPDGAATLPAVRVAASATREVADGPVQGYHATRSATGTRTDTALIDTPVSVQTVSRELMDDQQVLTIGQALANVSGVYRAHGPDGNTMDAFILRGFQVDSYGASYMDGVKDFSRSPKETAGLERVEVLKGPAAIMYGRIEPGGLINRVSKRPQAERATTIEQQVGTDALFRTSVDSTGTLNADATWRYRVNAVVLERDGFKDDTHARRLYLAPQVEWVPSEATSVRLGLEYMRDKRSWAMNYGTIGDPNGTIDVPIETNLHGLDEYYRDESTALKLDWSHRLNDAWRVQQRITWVDRRSVAHGSGLSAADTEGNYQRDYWGWEGEDTTVFSTNLELLGSLRTGGVKHTLLAGVDYYDEDYDSGGWAFGGTPTDSNIRNPVRGIDAYRDDYTVMRFYYRNRNKGLYLQEQAALIDERLHLLVGLRYDDARNSYGFDTGNFRPVDKKTTWRLGVLYKLQPTASVYASYVTGFGSSQYDWRSGTIYPPETSKQWEAGVKWEPHPDWGLTLAFYELTKDNLTMADPADAQRTILAGEARSRGVEFDLNGRLTPEWSLNFAYAYTDVKWVRSNDLQGERLTGVPRNGASLWTSYRFGGSGWKAGAGLTARNRMLGVQRAYASEATPYPYTHAGYVLGSLMVGYEFRLAGHAARAQLNVDNVGDVRYTPTTYGGSDRIGLGEPRSALLSLAMTF